MVCTSRGLLNSVGESHGFQREDVCVLILQSLLPQKLIPTRFILTGSFCDVLNSQPEEPRQGEQV